MRSALDQVEAGGARSEMPIAPDRAWFRALPLMRVDHLWTGLAFAPVMTLFGCTTYIISRRSGDETSFGAISLLLLLLSPPVAWLLTLPKLSQSPSTDRLRQLSPCSQKLWGEVRALVWMTFALLPPLTAVVVVLAKIALADAPWSDAQKVLSVGAIAALVGSLTWRSFHMRIAVAAFALSMAAGIWAVGVYSVGSILPPWWLSAVMFAVSVVICVVRANGVEDHFFLDEQAPFGVRRSRRQMQEPNWSLAKVQSDTGDPSQRALNAVPPSPAALRTELQEPQFTTLDLPPASGWAASPWRWLWARSLGTGLQKFHFCFAAYLGFMIGWQAGHVNGILLGLAMGTQAMSLSRQRQCQLHPFPISGWWRLGAAVLPTALMMLLGTCGGVLISHSKSSLDDFMIEPGENGAIEVHVPMVGWDLAWGPSYPDYQRARKYGRRTMIHMNPYAVAPSEVRPGKITKEHLESLQKALWDIAHIKADLPLLRSAVYGFRDDSLGSRRLKEVFPELDHSPAWRTTWRSSFLVCGLVLLGCMLLASAGFESRPEPDGSWSRATKLRLFVVLLLMAGIIAVMIMGDISEFGAILERILQPIEHFMAKLGGVGVLAVIAAYLLAFYAIGKLWLKSEFRHPPRKGQKDQFSKSIRSAK